MHLSHRFFYRLLGAFLAVGVLPVLVVAITLALASRSVLERGLLDRVADATAIAAGGLSTLLDGYAGLAEELAQDPAIIEYLATPVTKRDNSSITEATRRIYSAARTDRVASYLVPAEGLVLGTRSPPGAYTDLSMRSTGAIRFFADEMASSIEEHTRAQVNMFGRTESAGTDSAIVTIGRAVPASPLPHGPAGYVVIDLHSPLFDELFAGARNAVSELVLVDSKGTILYSLFNIQNEDSFLVHTRTEISGAIIDRNGSRAIATANPGYGFTLIASQTLSTVIAQTNSVRTAAIIAGICSALAAAACAFLLSTSISTPIRKLTEAMGQVESGNLSVRLEIQRSDDIGYMLGSFNTMVARIDELLETTAEQHRLLRQAEAHALLARIDPHFLYNTLNSIKAYAKLKGVEEIATIATQLGKLLRAGFAVDGEFSTMEESLELINSYLSIEAIRYPDRFEYKAEVDAKYMSAILPRLVLQPLVENAIKHGLENKAGKTCLTLSAHCNQGILAVSVEDNGTGITPERLELIRQKLAHKGGQEEFPAIDADSTGTALVNINKRLKLYYGPEYGLDICNRNGGGTISTIKVPCNIGDNNDQNSTT